MSVGIIPVCLPYPSERQTHRATPFARLAPPMNG